MKNDGNEGNEQDSFSKRKEKVKMKKQYDNRITKWLKQVEKNCNNLRT